jgi:hypothetical protein
MATKKKSSKRTAAEGRGSPEAIAKRRAARQLNTLLTGGVRDPNKIDGRTEKRRKRLIRELKDGKRGQPLKPIDFVSHVNELMEIGESLSSLKKHGVKPRKTELTPDNVAIAEQTQAAYSFRPEAWKMLGLNVSSSGGSGARRGGRRRARKK